jgi:predicted RNA-binding protein YlqC (UPF0109 family)
MRPGLNISRIDARVGASDIPLACIMCQCGTTVQRAVLDVGEVRSDLGMKELVEYMAENLVNDPGEVQVKQIERPHVTVLRLRVAQEDMGRVIGKGGRVANAMRALLNVAAAREGRRVILDID